MAEAYRGLTIRIGGDISGLTNALRAANRAITATTGEIRKLDSALRLNPSNMDAVSMKAGALANKAADLYTKFNDIRVAYNNLASSATRSDPTKTLADMADETGNVHLALNMVREDYAAIEAELERNYIQLTKWSKTLEGGTGSLYNNKNQRLADIRAEIDLLLEKNEPLRQQFEALYDSVARLQPLFQEVHAELEDLNSVADLEKYAAEALSIDESAKSMSASLVELESVSDIGKGLEAFDGRIQTVDAALDVAVEKVRSLDESLRLDPTNVDLVRERTAAYNDAVAIAEEKTNLLQQKLEAYRTAGIDRVAASTKNVAALMRDAELAYKDSTDAVARLEAELYDIEREQRAVRRESDEVREGFESEKRSVDEVRAELEAAKDVASQMNQNLDTARAVQEYVELEGQVRQTSTAMHDLGNVAANTTSGVVGIALIFATTLSRYFSQAASAVATAARDIDESYRNLRKTTDATEEQYERLLNSAKEFSLTHVTSADQILEIEALGGQFGIAAEDLEEFARAISNLEVATDIEAESAALLAGQMINVLDDLSPENINNFADALVRLGNNFPATESTIMNIAQRLASVGSIAGMTTPEVLAWSTAIASTGQKSEAAATALSRTIIQMQTAYDNAGGRLDAFAKAVNISADELSEAWGRSATEGLQLFIQGLSQLDESDDSAFAALEELGIDGIRQTQAILGLSQSVETLDDALIEANDAWTGTGDAEEEARKKAEGLSGKMSILENSAKVLAATLGDGLVPFIELATTWIQGLTDVFSELDTGVKVGIVAVGGLSIALAALNPVFRAIANSGTAFFSWLGSIGGAISMLGEKFLLAAADIPVLGEAIWAASEFAVPITAALGGLAIGVTALSIAYRENHKVAASVKERTDNLRDALWSTAPVIDKVRFGMEKETKSAEELYRGAKAAADAHAELADSIRQTNEAAQTNINNLGWAEGVIERYANQSELSADSQEKLKEAIEIVNEECGTQYTVVDALNGKIQDEEGNYLETTDAINDYIEAKQRAIQIDAYLNNQQAIYDQLVQDQLAYAEATEKLNELQDRGITEGAEYYDTLAAQESHARNIAADIETINELNERIYEIAGGEGEAAEEAEHLSVNMAMLEGAFSSSSKEMDAFKHALEEAGITQEEFESLSEGTASALIRSFDPVTGTFRNTEEAIKEAHEELDDLPEEVSVSVEANVDGMQEVETLNTLISNLPKTRAVEIRANTYYTESHIPRAAGGHVARFASGAIFAGPTMTKHGLVGEAGAEYYDGDHIVPLTNTKYSKPFIDMLANGVVSRLGSSGTVYNVYFDNVRVNSDERITAAFENFMYEIAREADM